MSFQEIDPNGDTLLILHNANAPFAVLSTSSNSQGLFGVRGHKSDVKSASESQDKATQSVRMQLSSKHLILASAYFQKLAASNWKETTPADGYSYVLNTHDWDEEALRVLMNIIHGRTTAVPRVVNLEMLAKIAVLVDYYQCHGTVDFFAKTWLSAQSIQTIPGYTERDYMLRLVVSSVFSDSDSFAVLTKTIIQNSTGPINSLGLPIRQSVIDALNRRREDVISNIVYGLHSLQRQLSANPKTCTIECSSIHLGTLVKGMVKMRVTDPQPTRPYTGLCLVTLRRSIRGIQDPSWQTNCTGLSATPAASTAPSQPQFGGGFGSNTGFGTNNGFVTNHSFGGFGGPAKIRPTPPTISVNPNCTLSKRTKTITQSADSSGGLVLSAFVSSE